MANTYTQIYMHVIFAVAHRDAMIDASWRDELYSYICGACSQRKHFVHAIGGTSNHVHLLVGMHPSESVSALVQSLKIQSTRWINDKYLGGRFAWQSGFGAFSYSASLLSAVKAYIANQEQHHRRVTFREELSDICRKAGIDFNPDYLMEDVV